MLQVVHVKTKRRRKFVADRARYVVERHSIDRCRAAWSRARHLACPWRGSRGTARRRPRPTAARNLLRHRGKEKLVHLWRALAALHFFCSKQILLKINAITQCVYVSAYINVWFVCRLGNLLIGT